MGIRRYEHYKERRGGRGGNKSNRLCRSEMKSLTMGHGRRTNTELVRTGRTPAGHVGSGGANYIYGTGFENIIGSACESQSLYTSNIVSNDICAVSANVIHNYHKLILKYLIILSDCNYCWDSCECFRSGNTGILSCDDFHRLYIHKGHSK